ncbi:MAG: sugar isomerase domain-containing protein [Chloroflexota bacterium]
MSGEIPAGRRYLRTAADLIERLEIQEWPNIQAAATLMADALVAGGSIHAFGSGHSHVLVEEAFYRAGGLVPIRPILFEGLMLHASAPLSTALERLPGLAAALLDDHPAATGDVLLIASNSGSNVVITEMARLARTRGIRTIAITSLQHATSDVAGHPGQPRLHELVDVTIDNGGIVGDAAITVEGMPTRVAPTSTVVGAAIVNTMVAEVVEHMVRKGVIPDVFTSSNVAGGDALNERHLRAGNSR